MALRPLLLIALFAAVLVADTTYKARASRPAIGHAASFPAAWQLPSKAVCEPHCTRLLRRLLQAAPAPQEGIAQQLPAPALDDAPLLQPAAAPQVLAPGPAPAVLQPSAAPPPPPYYYVPLTPAQRRRADALVTIFENASLQPQYGFAAVLGDGRGITFGRAGFTTETGDGLVVVERYVQLKPANNTLARYLPILRLRSVASRGAPQVELPDATNATATYAAAAPTRTTDLVGLDGFAETVRTLGNDSLFQRAQDYAVELFYYNASQWTAEDLGLRNALSKAQLYDAWVQHGEAKANSSHYNVSANGMAAWTTQVLGGSPLQGINETTWLAVFLGRRLEVIMTSPEFAARRSPTRIQLFTWLIMVGALELDKPLKLTYGQCGLVSNILVSGPCTQQPAAAYAIGGVVFGDFMVP